MLSYQPTRQLDQLVEATHYHLFELDARPGPYGYEVAVLRSPVGSAVAPLELPIQPALATGTALFESLLPPPIRSLYDASRHLALSQGQGLRLSIRTNAPVVAAVPWERAVDPRDGVPLVLAHTTPITRAVAAGRSLRPLPINGPLRLLVLLASPQDLAPLQLGHERERLSAIFGPLQRAGLLDVTWIEHATWRDLQQALRRGPWHAVHFAGHGGVDLATDTPYLALEDMDGTSYLLDAPRVGRLLSNHPSLRLVVLSACDGASTLRNQLSLAGQLVQSGVAAALAMQGQLSDYAATEFARTFYEALTQGVTLEAAVTDGRNAIDLCGAGDEWATPVLYLGSDLGALFAPSATHPALSSNHVVPGEQHAVRTPQARPTGHQPHTLHEATVAYAMPTGSRSTLPPGSRMPIGRNPLFVGRSELLQSLREYCAVDGATVILTGMGGIGKTQLAAEFAYQAGDQFPGGVYWLNFADPAAVPREIAACGCAAALDRNPQFASLPLLDQIDIVLAAVQQHEPCLLIFDGCEDEALLQRWRPYGGRSRIIVTSRRGMWDSTLDATVIPLSPLLRAESLALLRKHRPDLAAHDPALDALAAELGDHPLALHLAGRYLAYYRSVLSPAAYLNQLRSHGLSHCSLAGGGPSPTGHAQHIRTMLAWSWEQLAPHDPVDRLAIQLLDRLADLGSGELIERDLLVATHDAMLVMSALNRLVALGLVEHTADTKSFEWDLFRVHPLVAAFVRTTHA
jgi:hypothetical protein